ncbi:MAG TPA: methylated-DNA--[protein]-cysteine S-methyltransferase [Planctomycetota bacterium]|nr:methylated-DNA--[protein]-cysteine S-methyltransferase [Planctomycetota bacterium]
MRPTPFDLVAAEAIGSALWIAITQDGVRAIGRPGESENAFLARARKPASLGDRAPGCAAAHADVVRSELAALLEGRRPERRATLDLVGNDLARAVWSAIAAVPFGSRITYAALAAAAGAPRAVRAVAALNRGAPAPPFVPTHRVVNARGELVAPEGDPWTFLRKHLFERERGQTAR